MNSGFTTTFKIYGIGLDNLDHRNIALGRRGGNATLPLFLPSPET